MPKTRGEDGKYRPITGLSEAQYKAIIMLIYENYKTDKEIYESLGVPKSTYYHWFKQDLFKEELEKERKAFRRKIKNKAWSRVEDMLQNASNRDVTPILKMVLGDNEENYYLSDKLDVNVNSQMEFIITNEEDEEN